MRSLVGWVLILHALHCPVLFPDLDGECRGTPIQSLTEGHAWHVVLLGIRPNDDIDRGPIRTDDAGQERPSATVFDSYALVAARGFASAEFAIPTIFLDSGIPLHATTLPLREYGGSHSSPAIPRARAACISFCTWQI